MIKVENIEVFNFEGAIQAHWIRGAFADLTCSNCKFSLCAPYSLVPKLAYCPHCGARMSEEVQNDKQRKN